MMTSTSSIASTAFFSVWPNSVALPLVLSASMNGSPLRAIMSPVCMARASRNTTQVSPSVWPRPK